MACAPIITGDRFLTRALMHIDCQAQTVGTLGYQSLSEPGSLATGLMAGLLTLFVALIGIRFLFGPGPGVRDVVFDALKVGVVLTLAFSWPAFQTIVRDIAIDAPAGIAARLTAPVLNRADTRLLVQLQAADNAILELTRAGTGRNTGALLDVQAPGGTFGSTALRDEEGYAWARLVWLAGVIGSYGLLRLLAGLLLAVAPMAAGLLLFEQTRGLFSGWLRGLVLALIGMVGATLVLAVELAAIGPWLADALRVRQLGYATPAAPTELFALMLAFAAIQIGLIAILGKVAFTHGWHSLHHQFGRAREAAIAPMHESVARRDVVRMPSRAQHLADLIHLQVRRQGLAPGEAAAWRTGEAQSPRNAFAPRESAGYASVSGRLGSSYRRTAQRRSPASSARRSR